MKVVTLLLIAIIGGIFHKQCQWLAWRVWWHALTFVTQEITWRRAYVAYYSMLVAILPCYNQYYSTGVQIVSCTLSDDSVLSESTGLFNPVLCVSQWNLFWQKNQPMRLCLSNQVRSAREWSPSPLGDFIRLFEGLIGELFQIWHWNMFYFFKWHQSGP